MRNNIRYSLHGVIILTFVVLFISGCGYKTDPVYVSGSVSTIIELKK